jgi:poly [ADP-ribose] polymerase 2/3/4
MSFLKAITDFLRALKTRFLPGSVSLGKITPSGSGSVTRQYRMNYFDPGENSNKVWIGIAYSDGSFETRFGRVRDEANLVSSRKSFASQTAAENELERKRREKLRKGYKDTVVLDNTVQTAIVKDKKDKLSQIAADEIEGSTDKVTSELIKYLADINIHHITHSTSIKYNTNTGAFSTPLGVLTPEAISTARDLLTELRRLDGLQRKQRKKRDLTVREYFQLVPKDFGAKIPPAETLIATEEQFQEEAAILDALESAISTDKPLAARQKLFECRLIKIPHYTDEGREAFRQIRDLYFKTRNTTHHPGAAGLQMTRLYEVEIGEMKRKFDSTAASLGNVRDDLWHGTRASNLLSILKHGLVIPPSNAAHCTGRMFGNGIYTSLQSTKALNYATDFWNRSGKGGQRTFMFLCDVALGKVHKPRTFGGGYPVGGSNTTWVEPGKGGVLNHECIVYDTSQINLRFLAEFGAK